MTTEAFDLLPVGEYEFEVVTAVTDRSSGGFDVANLYVEVVAGPMAGSQAYTRITKTGRNVRALTAQLAAAGISLEWIRATTTSWDEVIALLPGRRFRARVGHTEFPVGSGRIRNDFGAWKPAA